MHDPFVSIITPVYNGEEYLAECIESVLAQTHSNWDYTIVNNCSKDNSLTIALEYAAKDRRIRVVNNTQFLPMIKNHNNAIGQMSLGSKYCKFVFADDWLYPTCIADMVRIAEENPSVGLVSAYTTDGEAVLWQGPSYPAHRVCGREVCRNKLMGGAYLFGTFTSLLVRSDLIRKRSVFFNERNLHADQEACFDVLQESDFGFIHQVLSFSRRRPLSAGSFAKEFDSIMVGEVVVFLKYGPVFLEHNEYRRCWKELRRQYHRVLAKNLLRMRRKEFWEYHESTLACSGERIHPILLSFCAILEVLSRLSDPLVALQQGSRWWSEAVGRVTEKRGMRSRGAGISSSDHGSSDHRVR